MSVILCDNVSLLNDEQLILPYMPACVKLYKLTHLNAGLVDADKDT